MSRTKVAALVLIAAAVVACAVNPVTGKKELMMYSEAQEIELGKQTDTEVAATYGCDLAVICSSHRQSRTSCRPSSTVQ